MKTMKIAGMMCQHCEAKVKKTLENVEGVASADVSYAEGAAKLACSGVSSETLKATVEALGYKVLEISEE